VIVEGEFAEDEEELITPAIEVTGVDVEDGGDVVLDVADGDSLGVKLKQGHGFVMKHGGAEIRWGAVVWFSSTTGWSPRRGRSLGGCSCRPLQGCAREGVGGTFGGRVALLGRGRGLLFRREGAGQSSIAGRGAFAL
jgi:hypothetical protein